jgi:hypothetical protein
MTAHYDTLLGAFAVIVGPIVGTRMAMGAVQAVPIEIPSGMAQLIGPMGALVGLVIALKWMTGRLNKSEDKYEARQMIIEKRDESKQVERDSQMKAIVALATETKDVIWQNSKAIEEFKVIVNGCPGAHILTKK